MVLPDHRIRTFRALHPDSAVPVAAFGAAVDAEAGTVCFRFRPSETPVGRLLAAVTAAGLTVADITTREPDLEDLFLRLTRESDAAREAAA